MTFPSLRRKFPLDFAQMGRKYCLRTHQIVAGDYFRKEALHRTAVATRNYNIAQGKAISAEERHLHEPGEMIIPDYETPRLRVVRAPAKFPIRLWKTQQHGYEDWIEIDGRSSTGGLDILKCPSPLRYEIIPREPVEEWLSDVMELSTSDAPELDDMATALEEQEVTARIRIQPVNETPVAISHLEPESAIQIEQGVSESISESQMSLAPEAERVPRWKRLIRSLLSSKRAFFRLVSISSKPCFRNDNRSLHSNDDHSRLISPFSCSRRGNIGDHSISRPTPVQRMRAIAGIMMSSLEWRRG